MRSLYKPTENNTLRNFHFRSLIQQETESFISFCNRVQKEATHCNFKCSSNDCTAENIAIRDQIIIGLIENSIRQEALKMSWDLVELKKNGMAMESALKGGAELAGENVNKLGKYSYRSLEKGDTNVRKDIDCFNCGYKITGSIAKHKAKCPAKNSECSKCNKHFASWYQNNGGKKKHQKVECK